LNNINLCHIKAIISLILLFYSFLSFSQAPNDYEIINSTGQIVFKSTLVEKTVVNTAGFRLGVYLIKFGQKEITEYIKFIKY